MVTCPHRKGVVPTFIIDTPAVFALGVLLSFLALETRARRPFYAVWPFVPAMAICTLFLGTAVLSYLVAPDWMYLYYFPRPELGLARLAYMAAVLYYAPCALGFAIGLDLRRRSRIKALLLLLAAGLCEFLVIRTVYDRYAFVGTRKEWLAGSAIPLAEHGGIFRATFFGLALMAIVFVGVVFGCILRRREFRESPNLPFLNEGEETILAAAAACFFPGEATGLAPKLSRYIGDMTLPNRMGIRLVIFAFGWLPLMVLWTPRRFTGLSTKDKRRYLDRLARHRLLPIRTVFIVLKTVFSLLYFSDPVVRKRFGIDFHCRGVHRPPLLAE